MDRQTKAETNAPPSFIKSVFIGLKAYLTDWRNLLGHALLGVFFVIVAYGRRSTSGLSLESSPV
jgi:hypothetical protein